MTEQKTRKVLVLDDSETVLEMTQMALEEAGYQVVTVSSPARFISALFREEPDLALIDVSMPDLDGGQLMKMAKANRTHSCRLIFYSDQPQSALEALVVSCGADGYIRKTNDEALVKEVQRFLESPSPGEVK